MKLYLICLLSMLCIAVPLRAAFPVNTPPVKEYKYTPPHIRSNDGGGGGFGIAALVTSLVGFSLPFSFVPTIILAGIGMRRDRKCRDLAVAGLILGCVNFAMHILIFYFMGGFS